MKNANIRLLIGSFSLVSIITLFNIVILYWAPVIIPFSSFSAVRLMFVALIENKYWLILPSVLICALLFLTPVFAYRCHILLPLLSLMYLIYDLIIVLSLLIDGLGDGYWRMYIIQTVVTATLIVSLCTNCCTYFRKSVAQGSTDGDH